MKKNLVLLFFIMILNSVSFAQESGSISGIVKDSKGMPFGFANVALIQKETGSIKTGSTTDPSGKFQIKTPSQGNYFLKVTFIGYLPTETESFLIPNENFS